MSQSMAEKLENGTIMVRGTEWGLDYLALARRGNVVLAGKPLGMVDGAKADKPGNLGFVVRLRSADMSAYFNDTKAVDDVPVDAAWSKINSWAKVATSNIDKRAYASTLVVRYVDGFDGELGEFLKALMQDGKLVVLMRHFLLSFTTGADSLLVTEEQLSAWLCDNYYPEFMKIIKFGAASQKVKGGTPNMGENNVFGAQMSLLNKLNKDKKPQDEEEEE